MTDTGRDEVLSTEYIWGDVAATPMTKGTESVKDVVTGIVALQCKLAQMDGYNLKKKSKRFNKIAEYHMMTCAGDFMDRYYIGECVLLCSDDPIMGSLYEDLNDLISAEKWMFLDD